MDNQQDYILNSNQIQVLLTGTFGDGHIAETPNKKGYYQTSGIYKEYIEVKKALLGNLVTADVRSEINGGYKDNIIHKFSSLRTESIYNLHKLSLEEKLNKLNSLGIALWFYDDGSLHQKKQFYNLCTHKFTEEEHKEILIPYFKSKGTNPVLRIERKADDRVFFYLSFNRHDGAFKITQMLRKHYVECFEYKMWSSETIQKWSKLQAQLKSEDMNVSKRKFTNLLNSYKI